MKALLLSCLLLIPTATCMAGDFDYGAYQDSSLASVGSNLDISPEITWWLDAAHSKFHTVATFTGQVRPIPDETRGLIDHWAKAMGHGKAIAAMFTSEIEVQQGNEVYWLPIQEQLVGALREEVPAGREVHLYVLLIGAYKLAPVFGVNEFGAAEG